MAGASCRKRKSVLINPNYKIKVPASDGYASCVRGANSAALFLIFDLEPCWLPVAADGRIRAGTAERERERERELVILAMKRLAGTINCKPADTLADSPGSQC
jgi:hypothetical protein